MSTRNVLISNIQVRMSLSTEVLIGGAVIGGIIIFSGGGGIIKGAGEIIQDAAKVLDAFIVNGVKFVHFFGALLVDEFGLVVSAISFIFYRLEGLFTRDADTALSAIYNEALNNLTDSATQKKAWQIRNWAMCMGLPYHYIDIGGQRARDNISTIRSLAKKAANERNWCYNFLLTAPYDEFVKVSRQGVNNRSFISPYYARRDKFNGIFSALDRDVYNKFNDYQPIDQFYRQFFEEYRKQTTLAFDYMHDVNILIGRLQGNVSGAIQYCVSDAINGMMQDMKYIYENHTLPTGIQAYPSLVLARPATSAYEVRFQQNYQELLLLYNTHHLGILPPDRMGENTINVKERTLVTEQQRVEQLDQLTIDAHLATERDRQFGAYYLYVGREGLLPPIGADGRYDYSRYPDIYPRIIPGIVVPTDFANPPARSRKVEQQIMKARGCTTMPDSLVNTDLREILTITQIYELDYYNIQTDGTNIAIGSLINGEIEKRNARERLEKHKESLKVVLRV